MPDTQDPQQIIEGEIVTALAQQKELEKLQVALSQNEQFTRFMELSKAVTTKMDEVREHIKAVMIPAYREGKINKKITGDWGSCTVTEEDDFDIDEEKLSKTYFKRVVNKALIKSDYQLKGKAPKGATHRKKYGIMLKVSSKQ